MRGPTTPTDSSTTGDTGTAADSGVDSGPIIVDSGVDAKADSGVDSGGCYKPPPSAVCGNAPQCGCTATQTCDTTNVTTGAMACITAGAVTMGKACTTTSQCAVGLRCWDGACRPYCNNPGANCTVAKTTLCFTPDQPPPVAAGTPSVNLNVCAVTCDPRVPTTDCGTNGCLFFSGPNVTDCRGPGTLDRDALCGDGSIFDNPILGACKPGNTCYQHPLYGSECEKWCRIGVAGDCAGGGFPPYTCNDIYGAAAPTSGAVRLGLCQ